MLFLKILAYVIGIPGSFFVLQNLLRWFCFITEFKFLPFRWTEGNISTLALPTLVATILWLTFWIWWFIH
jgi:hypothetical protein